MDSIQYKTVGKFSYDGTERDSSVVAFVADVPLFGDRDNIAPRPLVWFLSFDEEAFGKVQYDIVQGPVVRNMDNAIHRINHYPVDSAIGFRNVYPLDSDLSGG